MSEVKEVLFWLIFWLIPWVVFVVVDVVCYVKAPWPFRDRWYYKLPGGGYAALIQSKIRRDTKP